MIWYSNKSRKWAVGESGTPNPIRPHECRSEEYLDHRPVTVPSDRSRRTKLAPPHDHEADLFL